MISAIVGYLLRTNVVPTWIPAQKALQKVKRCWGGVWQDICEWHGSALREVDLQQPSAPLQLSHRALVYFPCCR